MSRNNNRANSTSSMSSSNVNSVATNFSAISPKSKPVKTYTPPKSMLTAKEKEDRGIHRNSLVGSTVQKPNLSFRSSFDGTLEGHHLTPVFGPIPPPPITKWTQPLQDRLPPSVKSPKSAIPTSFKGSKPGPPPAVKSFKSGSAPPAMRPESGLSGKSPAFNPGNPTTTINRNLPRYGPPTPQPASIQKLQNVIQGMRLAPQGPRGIYQNYGQHPQQHGLVPIYNHGGPVIPPIGPRHPQRDGYPQHRHPQTQLVRQNKAPETWINRLDRGARDLIISAEGIKRNAVKYTRTFDQYGNSNGVTVEHIYDAPAYDFATEFKSWSKEEKKAFLGKTFVEISFKLKTPEEEVEAVQRAKETGRDDWAQNTAIDIIEALGTEFAEYAKKVTVTMRFPDTPTPRAVAANTKTAVVPTSGSGLVAPSVTFARGPKSHAPQANITTPNFLFLTRLATHLETYTSLSHLTILMKVPPNNRMPVTMPQLYHALPFYDLTFTDWDIKYLPEKLSVPLLVTGWALGQLDRERNRIAKEKLKKEEAAAKEEREKYLNLTPRIIPSAMQEFGAVSWVGKSAQ